MKKVSVMMLLMFCVSAAHAGTWDVLSGFLKESVKPVEYEVSTSGANLRVYEWETPTGKICTSVISSKGIAMDCDWKRENKKP